MGRLHAVRRVIVRLRALYPHPCAHCGAEAFMFDTDDGQGSACRCCAGRWWLVPLDQYDRAVKALAARKVA